MTAIVLDASAVLAVISEERGADNVIQALRRGAVMSAVNYAEVISKLVERGLRRELARATVLNIGIQILDFDIELADRVGELRPQTKSYGLSLADRACLALAERQGLPALTGDRKWSQFDLGIEVRIFR
jgi:PIN domain nuclease of toxin-antitoxin system